MNALIDEALETLMHSAIWRITWHLELTTLIIIAVVAFIVLAYRRRKNTGSKHRRGRKYWSRR